MCGDAEVVDEVAVRLATRAVMSNLAGDLKGVHSVCVVEGRESTDTRTRGWQDRCRLMAALRRSLGCDQRR